MKKPSDTDSQIISILHQAEAGAKALDLCGEHGVSNATFYKCCSAGPFYDPIEWRAILPTRRLETVI